MSSIRTINSGETTYNMTYPQIGFSPDLLSLGTQAAPIGPPRANRLRQLPALIDAVLSNNGNPGGSGKSGYLFTSGAGTKAGGVNVGYTVKAVPITINQTGIREFCAEEDAVVRVDPAGVCSDTEAGILTFNPLNQ